MWHTFQPPTANGYTANAVKLAAGNTLSQGIGSALGMGAFNWRSVSVSALMAPISQAVNSAVGSLDLFKYDPTGLAAPLIGSMANGVIGQEIRMKVYRQGKLDYQAISADAFGNALGNSLVDKMQNASGEQKLKDEQAAKQAVEKSRRPLPAVSDYQEPDYSLLPKGAHAKLPQIQNSPTSAADESGAQTVRAGDYKGSLESIAREQLGADASQHDINNYVGQLFELNGITNSRKIQPDQQIILPDANTAAATKGLKQYGQDISKGNARKYSLPDGWNMLDASAASNAAGRAASNTRLVSDMLAGRASEPDNAIGKFKQDALDWIVDQGARTNSPAGQLGWALAYGAADVSMPEGYGDAALMVGGVALSAGVRAVRGLEVTNTTEQFISDVHGAIRQKLNTGELAEFQTLDSTSKIGLTGSSATGRVGNPNKATFGQPIDTTKFDLDLFVQSDVLLERFGSKLQAAPTLRQSLVNDFPNLFNGLKPGEDGLSIKFRPHGQPPKGSVIFE